MSDEPTLTLSELRELHKDDLPNDLPNERPAEIERYKKRAEDLRREAQLQIQDIHEEFDTGLAQLYESAKAAGLLDIEGNAPWNVDYETAPPETTQAIKILDSIARNITGGQGYDLLQYENRTVYLTMLDHPTWGYELAFYVNDLNRCKPADIEHFIRAKMEFMKAVDGEPDTSPMTADDDFGWLFDPLDYSGG
jgi:hypothetical protein